MVDVAVSVIVKASAGLAPKSPQVNVVRSVLIDKERFPVGACSADQTGDGVHPPLTPETTPDEFTCKHCVDPVIPLNAIVPLAVIAPNVCVAVHVFAWPRFKDATTAPVVGEMVNVESEFDTEVTAPDPVPQAALVGVTRPVLPICRQ